MEGWGAVLESVEVLAGTGGIFDVHVDGDLVFEKRMIGRYPQPEDVIPLVRDRIGPEVMPRR